MMSRMHMNDEWILKGGAVGRGLAGGSRGAAGESGQMYTICIPLNVNDAIQTGYILEVR